MSVKSAAQHGPTLGGLLADVGGFARHVLGRPLRPYQLKVARAIVADVLARQRHRIQSGGLWTVMMARQMGKNEVSAVIEAYLLTRHAQHGGTIIKAAPTWQPQGVTSFTRLRELLDNSLHRGQGIRQDHQALTLGRARATFYSAQPSAHVVGATASLLLEVDEAQDVDREKFQRDFLPMAAAHNTVVVLYGTAWTDDTLLEQERQHNLAAQRAGGEQRHFEYPWTFGAAVMPAYRQFVEHEIERLGAQHPLIRTQYLLQTVADRSALFSPEQRLLLQGTHARQTAPCDGEEYVAAIDVAGAATGDGGQSPVVSSQEVEKRDSTVVGIAAVTRTDDEVRLRLVEVYWWTNRPLHEQYARLAHLLGEVWHCRRVVVDATGLGADLATRLRRALGTSRGRSVCVHGSDEIASRLRPARCGQRRAAADLAAGPFGRAGGTVAAGRGSAHAATRERPADLLCPRSPRPRRFRHDAGAAGTGRGRPGATDHDHLCAAGDDVVRGRDSAVLRAWPHPPAPSPSLGDGERGCAALVPSFRPPYGSPAAQGDGLFPPLELAPGEGQGGGQST